MAYHEHISLILEYVHSSAVMSACEQSANSLLQLPEWMWMDDTTHGGESIREVLTSLKGILEDGLHVLLRVSRTIPDSHCLKCE
jgi:hypothetical protein